MAVIPRLSSLLPGRARFTLLQQCVRAIAILPGGTDTPANHANLTGAPEGTRGRDRESDVACGVFRYTADHAGGP